MRFCYLIVNVFVIFLNNVLHKQEREHLYIYMCEKKR